MTTGQRSNWLAGRLAIVGSGLMLIAAVVEFRPTSSEVAWRTYAAGLEEAAATGKPVYVDLYATWCGPCKEMDQVTFRDDSVRAWLERAYVPVRIDIDTRQYDDTLKTAWNLKAVPTSLIVSAGGSVLGRRTGYQSPRDFAAWLSDPALLAYAGWLDYREARRRSRATGRPLVVVITSTPDNLEEIQNFFLDPRLRSFLQSRAIVTRIAGDAPADRAQLAELRRSYQLAVVPVDGILMVSTHPDGRLLGQVVVGSNDLEDQERIVGLLESQLNSISGEAPSRTRSNR